MLTSDDLAVKIDHWGADLWLLVGRRGSGKSTLGEWQVKRFWSDYPTGRILVADTKPRFRAQFTADGLDAGKRYRDWGYGSVLPNFRACGSAKEVDLAWKTGARGVVLQNDRAPQDQLIRWQVEMIERFWRTQKKSTPSLLYIDESMDFFGPTGLGKYGDTIQRICRAGREKGLAAVIASQRPKTINMQVVTEANCLANFALNLSDDRKRLYEMGLPRGAKGPTVNKQFLLMRDGVVLSDRAQLAL